MRVGRVKGGKENGRGGEKKGGGHVYVMQQRYQRGGKGEEVGEEEGDKGWGGNGEVR